jgi:GT2 family glycosyltransferase
MKSVSIITVNFNHSDVTEALLRSIARTNTYNNVEIIVVDNGSTTNPIPGWELSYPSVTFIRSEINLGFAGGNNVAIKAAKGDYLFFVNNDTEFAEGLVASLVQTLDEHEEVGMVSPKIHYYNEPGMLQYAGFSRMNYYTARTSSIGQFEKDNGQYDQLTGETGFVHGAAMMVRRTGLEKGGLMPEHYFLYYEEMDWCEQIRKAGYTVWVNLQALIFHKESATVGSNSPLKVYFMNRNRILFIRRNCTLKVRMFFWPYFIFVVGVRNIIGYIKNGQWAFIKHFVKAILWNMTNDVNSTNLGYPINR